MFAFFNTLCIGISNQCYFCLAIANTVCNISSYKNEEKQCSVGAKHFRQNVFLCHKFQQQVLRSACKRTVALKNTWKTFFYELAFSRNSCQCYILLYFLFSTSKQALSQKLTSNFVYNLQLHLNTNYYFLIFYA